VRECVCVCVFVCWWGGGGGEGVVSVYSFWYVVERETEKKDRKNVCVCAYIKK